MFRDDEARGQETRLVNASSCHQYLIVARKSAANVGSSSRASFVIWSGGVVQSGAHLSARARSSSSSSSCTSTGSSSSSSLSSCSSLSSSWTKRRLATFLTRESAGIRGSCAPKPLSLPRTQSPPRAAPPAAFPPTQSTVRSFRLFRPGQRNGTLSR